MNQHVDGSRNPINDCLQHADRLLISRYRSGDQVNATTGQQLADRNLRIASWLADRFSPGQ